MAKKDPIFVKNTFREEPDEAEIVAAETKKSKSAAKEKKSRPAKKKSKAEHGGVFRFLKDDRFHKVSGLFLLLFAFYLLASFSSYLFTWKADDNIFHNSISRVLFDNELISENWMGKLGAVLSYLFIKSWFGVPSYLFVFIMLLFGLRLFINVKPLPLSRSFWYSLFSLLWFSIALSFFFRGSDTLIFGGVFGYKMNQWMWAVLGQAGTIILLVFSLLSFLIVEYRIHRLWLRKPKAVPGEDETPEEEGNQSNFFVDVPVAETEEELLPEEEPFIAVAGSDATDEEAVSGNTEDSSGIEFTIETTSEEEESAEVKTEGSSLDTPFDPTLELSGYRFPGLDLLNEYDTSNIAVDQQELEANKNRIIKTLGNYSIQIDKINATIGPTVTLYEIVPAPGVRISRIKNLEDDIALSLSALGIRIIAPMPGKGTIGIEVPNLNPKTVSMKSILASEAFQDARYDLPIGLGKTISNKPFVFDLAKMPHLLMAGATGQGKSVGLNAIIASLLYKKHPSQLKFILIDPKKVELTLYSRIERHFLAKLPDAEEAIITDTRKVVRTLNALCIEMDERYDLLKDAQVRNIKEYNAKFISRKLNPNNGHRFLPYIVLVVDEFADLIITAGKEVETPITRLAQLARAIGIHLIVATQRPSVNVITGTIKANFPARVAYRVISKIDSRTILDQGGADQLVGRGDMLLSTGSDLVRLQCAFIDTPEVEVITDFIGQQRGYPEAYALPECPDEESDNAKNLDPSERDEMFEEAARVIVSHQHGSTSLLQRKLKLGYNRAGRIIDQLEAAGIIGPFEGSKAREVRIKDMMALEQYLSELK
jgi:DNA segregation ATPase FtsK/SpoIIIE, S-DNA-T family